MYKKLTVQAFDEIIKQNLIGSGMNASCFTYKIENREYPLYYNEEEFNLFVQEMKTNYYNHYIKFKGDYEKNENQGGKGGELEVKKGRYGMMPPKMASVASSSRFCYLALRDGCDILIEDRNILKNEIEFEKECRIFENSITAPQLDAYIEDENCNVYIEAKCHEIFSSHKPVFKHKYWDCFYNDSAFSKVLHEKDRYINTFELALSTFDIKKESTRFDIKQFVCHLLGIANCNKGKKAKLVYLFYKPLTEDERVETVFNELNDEIKTIFNCEVIRDFCKAHNIELMAIAQCSKVMQKLEKNNVIYFVK